MKTTVKAFFISLPSVIAAGCILWLVFNFNSLQSKSYIAGCRHTNQLAHGFTDQSLTARELSLQATLSNPLSTPDQRATAQTNLTDLKNYIKYVIDPIASDKLCVWPPVPVPRVSIPSAVTSTTSP